MINKSYDKISSWFFFMQLMSLHSLKGGVVLLKIPGSDAHYEELNQVSANFCEKVFSEYEGFLEIISYYHKEEELIAAFKLELESKVSSSFVNDIEVWLKSYSIELNSRCKFIDAWELIAFRVVNFNSSHFVFDGFEFVDIKKIIDELRKLIDYQDVAYELSEKVKNSSELWDKELLNRIEDIDFFLDKIVYQFSFVRLKDIISKLNDSVGKKKMAALLNRMFKQDLPIAEQFLDAGKWLSI